MSRTTILLPLIFAAAPLAAADLPLEFPLNCRLGEDCFVQQFVDQDPAEGQSRDYLCGPLTYDGHRGTDFRLIDDADIADDVQVMAAAPGIVRATRDGMQDFRQNAPGAPDVSGVECGNGVRIDHGGGWETQYCHMKEGSIAVSKGMRVGAGDVLGTVGLSGKTDFAHVQLTVRKDGEVIDPFAPDRVGSCGARPEHTLWSTPIPELPGAIMKIGFAPALPDFEDIRSGAIRADNIDKSSDALILWAFFFGARPGDEVALEVVGPNRFAMEKVFQIDRVHAQGYRAFGRKLRARQWAPGSYEGRARLIRDGQTLNTRRVTATISR